LIPFGSHGDVHPFMGLGKALQERGHHISCMAFDHFAPLVQSMGFELISYGEQGEYEKAIDNPDLWHPRRSFDVMVDGIGKGIEPIFEAIAERFVPGETVVIAGTLAFGARVAQDKLGVPTATVHLQPGVFRTEYAIPLMAGFEFLPKLPRIARRWFFKLITLLTDQKLSRKVNPIRARLGLAPARDIMFSWVNSPELVLGLFPDWFGPPQPDWPRQTELVGFPLFDETGVRTLSSELEDFLKSGEPPIIFTPGSAMKHAHAYFEVAVEACRRLKRRGLLLTRFAEQIPARLPETVRHFDYAPFSHVLPRAAAFVHHGGVGTSAQAMACAVPQLVMPLAHDQFDNAARMVRLGVARSLPQPRFIIHRVMPLLDELLTSRAITDNCREISARIKQDTSLAKACDAIERLATRSAQPEAKLSHV
jgi:UDP:flavonoid glycosyltransferase YjiC (YdhE family)